jgi:hypothetical protein
MEPASRDLSGRAVNLAIIVAIDLCAQDRNFLFPQRVEFPPLAMNLPF